MKWMIALALIFSCGLAAWGAETDPAQMKQLVMRLDLVQLKNDGAAQLEERLPAGFVAQAVKSGSGYVVHSSELMIVTRRDSMCFIGRKSPVTYYDPKSSQFQIQYVDTGLKLYVTCRQAGTAYEIDASAEYSLIDGIRAPGGPTALTFPITEIISSKTRLATVHPGDSILVGHAFGPETRRLLTAMGVTGTGDHLVLIITLLNP